MDRHFTLLVGSVLGASEYVADALAEALRTRGYKTTVLAQPDINTQSEIRKVQEAGARPNS